MICRERDTQLVGKREREKKCRGNYCILLGIRITLFCYGSDHHAKKGTHEGYRTGHILITQCIKVNVKDLQRYCVYKNSTKYIYISGVERIQRCVCKIISYNTSFLDHLIFKPQKPDLSTPLVFILTSLSVVIH